MACLRPDPNPLEVVLANFAQYQLQLLHNRNTSAWHITELHLKSCTLGVEDVLDIGLLDAVDVRVHLQDDHIETGLLNALIEGSRLVRINAQPDSGLNK